MSDTIRPRRRPVRARDSARPICRPNTPPIDVDRLRSLMSQHHLIAEQLAGRSGVAEVLICWRLKVPGPILERELVALAWVLGVQPRELVRAESAR